MAYRFASRRAALLALIVGACLAAPAAWAQHETIVVNDPDDGSDFAAPQTVAQLPGPDGHVTLREAVAAANNTPGPQTIHFQIPQSAWFSVYPDRATVFVYINPYILTDDSTTIDGRSQTLFSGDTNPNGNEVAFWGEHPNAAGSPLFIVHSDGNTFAGLDAVQRRGYGITLSDDAEGNRVIANTISGPLYAAVQVIGSHNTVGGILPGEGNRLTAGNDGVRVESAFETPPPTGNRIIGNYLSGSSAGIRVRAGAVGTLIGGPTAAERNVIADAGRFGEEGFPTGVQVAIEDATGTVVEGNYIGLTADGTASSVQTGPAGVSVSAGINTVIRGNAIGGIRVEGRNHYAGQFFGVGVQIQGTTTGTLVVGNRIGTRADGQGPVPNLNGVRVSTGPPTNTTIGGTNPGDGNLIAYNERDGVAVDAFVTGVAVLGNAVFENGQEGIDLALDGPTANDVHDPDEGPNRLQNHPVIEQASLADGEMTVVYRVDTAPENATYPLRVEFFLADAAGTEGEAFLGADTYTAADYANGTPGPRTATFPAEPQRTGALVLATATDAAGNTSEFGAGVLLQSGITTASEGEGGALAPALTVAPNPAHGRTVAALTLPDAGIATVAVYDALGRRVATLHDGALAAGTHTLAFDAAALPAGVYVLRATTEGLTLTRRMTVTR